VIAGSCADEEISSADALLRWVEAESSSVEAEDGAREEVLQLVLAVLVHQSLGLAHGARARDHVRPELVGVGVQGAKLGKRQHAEQQHQRRHHAERREQLGADRNSPGAFQVAGVRLTGVRGPREQVERATVRPMTAWRPA